MEPTKEPKKRTRRTKEEMEAARGAELAREVGRLSLSQLASFAQALSAEVGEYVTEKIRGVGK
jgi:hypothetical protein